MPKSELARERDKWRKAIKRGEARGVEFDLPVDVNHAPLSVLKAFYPHLYDNATITTRNGTVLEGKDFRKYLNMQRTAHARGVEMLDLEASEEMKQNPTETYDEQRDKFPAPTPDYDDDMTFDVSALREPPRFSSYTAPDDVTYRMAMTQIRALATEYDERATEALLQQINIAEAQLGKKAVVTNIKNNASNLVDFATAVAMYYGKQGFTALEIRTRNFDNFVATLYGFSSERLKADAVIDAKRKIARAEGKQVREVLQTASEMLQTAMGTENVKQLQSFILPENALTFRTVEEGLNAGYVNFYYRDSETGEWKYHKGKK